MIKIGTTKEKYQMNQKLRQKNEKSQKYLTFFNKVDRNGRKYKKEVQ